MLAVAGWLLWRGGGWWQGEDLTWQAMQEQGSWRVGMDPSFPPFEFLDGQGRPTGYDVALAQEMADQWGLDVQVVAIGFDSLLDALLAGKIQSIVSAYPLDPRMAKDVAYSPPYFEAGIRLAVLPGSSIRAITDLTGRTVAVEWGGMGDVVGRRLQREIPDLTLRPFETVLEAARAVEDAEVDAVLLDGVTLGLRQAQGSELHALDEALEPNPYVIAMPLAASQLHAQVQVALAELQNSGRLAALESKWFADPQISVED